MVSIGGDWITVNTEHKMSPIADNLPDSLAAGESPVAVVLPPPSPKTKKPVAKPGQGIPPSVKPSVAENPLSADVDLENGVPPGPEPVAKPSREDRKSPRSAVPQARRSCELRVGSSVMAALLMDRSAGGFAVVVDRIEGLKAGKKVELVTDLGRFKVKVVYINKIARPKDASTQSDVWYRLGLKIARSFCLF
jgi:hypothetical protein